MKKRSGMTPVSVSLNREVGTIEVKDRTWFCFINHIPFFTAHFGIYVGKIKNNNSSSFWFFYFLWKKVMTEMNKNITEFQNNDKDYGLSLSRQR